MGNVQQHIGKRTTVGGREVEVVKYLGEGGSSFIFLVRDATSASAQPMVLKRLLAENETALEWIHSEIRMHQRFRHPQIVEFIASQTNRSRGSEREVFILMEYCPSGHLYENMMKMGEKRFTERELLRVFKQLCVPVSVLHRENPPIAHRDLKLENFLMAKNGIYKLCDFGSCAEGPQSLKTKEDRAREVENVLKRTTAMYRSPELADVEGTAMFGAGELTETVDVWAMGCILYTMAFFKPPFPPEGLRTERYTIPEGSKYSTNVHTLIKRMLTADVEMRATLDHVMDCCDEIMDGRPIPSLPRSGSASSPKKTSTSDKKPAAATAAATTKSRDSSFDSKTTTAKSKTTEARKETLPASKPAMDLLDMDFNPTISATGGAAKTASGSFEATPSSGWTTAPPTDGFGDFASFPSPSASGAASSDAFGGKRMDEFGFPASPVKQQHASGFTAPPVSAMHTPASAAVDPFEELGAPPAPMMGGRSPVQGFNQGYHHQPPMQQQQQQFYGHQPQGFYPPVQAHHQQQPLQGFYQPQQQQPQHMWGAPQQQPFGANGMNNNRF
uniref:non-specific serine/threonine protein kinase n=1 Tax=Globisporangium ultimum (strain ATCC 200006 / CBS 805.95 / DAOM BR144) TaxID=431595 RepID=K3X3S4_GLOUD